jgi:site-specific DNA recombinase
VPDKPIVPAVLYAAKSTEDKHGSIPDQLRKTRRLSEREEWQMFGEFTDEGFSAYSGNRGPGLEEAKEKVVELAATYGECVLVALHSDRVARGAGDEPNAADHLVEVVAFLRRHGVRLRTVEDDFFADDRIGLLMAAVQGQRNTEDSRRKSESVAAGFRRRAEERGQHSGPPPYGYRYAEDKSGLVVIPAEAEIVRRIFNEYVAGRSMTQIAKGLHGDGVKTKKGAYWRQAQISGFLRNTIYIGKVKYKDELFDGIHEPIIDAVLWEKATQLVEAMPSKPGRPPKEKRHLFTAGFLRCANCGDPMTPCTRPNRNYEYYECTGRIHGCKTGAVRRRDIDEGVFAYFEQIAFDVEATREHVAAAIDQKVSEANALATTAETEAQEAAQRLEKVRRDYTHGELTAADWRELKAELEPEAVAAEAQAQRLREQAATVKSNAALGNAETEVIEQLSRLRAAVAGDITSAADLDAVRAVLRRLFDCFLFHPEVPDQAHIELTGNRYWIEPVVSERAIAGYDEKHRPVIARQPLERAENNYAQASGWL